MKTMKICMLLVVSLFFMETVFAADCFSPRSGMCVARSAGHHAGKAGR